LEFLGEICGDNVSWDLFLDYKGVVEQRLACVVVEWDNIVKGGSECQQLIAAGWYPNLPQRYNRKRLRTVVTRRIRKLFDVSKT
jgi:hypothetical protein